MSGPRFRQIADDLRRQIALGELGDSGAIESEAALGARYGASRVTVRRALELLRDEGLVESRKGSGWFATGASFHQRLALGTFRHATSAIAEAGQEVRRDVVTFAYRPAPAPEAAALEVEPGSEVLHSRSVRTVGGVALDLADEWVPATAAAELSRAAAADPGIWASLQRAGHRITTVRQTIAAGIAGRDDAGLLGVDPASPVLLVRRLALAGDRPVALSDHRYVAHRFALEVEFNGWPGAAVEAPPGLRAVDPSPIPDANQETATA
jgi:GntR family transcriptional regulator